MAENRHDLNANILLGLRGSRSGGMTHCVPRVCYWRRRDGATADDINEQCQSGGYAAFVAAVRYSAFAQTRSPIWPMPVSRAKLNLLTIKENPEIYRILHRTRITRTLKT
jgi:hypothetical protein